MVEVSGVIEVTKGLGNSAIKLLNSDLQTIQTFSHSDSSDGQTFRHSDLGCRSARMSLS